MDRRWTYYITEVSQHEVSIFGDAGAGVFEMYGPFDTRYEYSRFEMQQRVDGLERWGYHEVEAPTLAEHRKRLASGN